MKISEPETDIELPLFKTKNGLAWRATVTVVGDDESPRMRLFHLRALLEGLPGEVRGALLQPYLANANLMASAAAAALAKIRDSAKGDDTIGQMLNVIEAALAGYEAAAKQNETLRRRAREALCDAIERPHAGRVYEAVDALDRYFNRNGAKL